MAKKYSTNMKPVKNHQDHEVLEKLLMINFKGGKKNVKKKKECIL